MARYAELVRLASTVLVRIYTMQAEDVIMKRPFVFEGNRYDSEDGYLWATVQELRFLILEREPSLEYEEEEM